MENSKLAILIKKINRSKLIMPFVFILFIGIIYVNNPLYQLLSPTILSSPSDINTLYKEDIRYINATFSDLYYTSLNYAVKSTPKGAYYYTLHNGTCYYILIPINELNTDPETGQPPSYIESYTCKAKLVKDSDTITKIIDNTSTNLNWTNSALSLMSCKIIIDEYVLSLNYEYFLLAVTIFTAIMSCVHLFIVVISLIDVNYSRTILRLKNFGDVTALSTLAAEEFETPRYSSEKMLITEHFYIAYDRHNIHIIPLENIVWAYKFGTMKHSIFHTKIRYSISVVTNPKKTFITHNKSKNATEYILNALQSCYPEILIGYNEGKM